MITNSEGSWKAVVVIQERKAAGGLDWGGGREGEGYILKVKPKGFSGLPNMKCEERVDDDPKIF